MEILQKNTLNFLNSKRLKNLKSWELKAIRKSNCLLKLCINKVYFLLTKFHIYPYWHTQTESCFIITSLPRPSLHARQVCKAFHFRPFSFVVCARAFSLFLLSFLQSEAAAQRDWGLFCNKAGEERRKHLFFLTQYKAQPQPAFK